MEANQVQDADPAARRRALLWWAVAVAVGFPLVWAADRYRDQWAAWLANHSDTVRAHGWIVPVATLLVVAPLLLFVVYLWRFGRRVVANERFPPLGCRTVRDTPVLEGARAVVRGRVLQVLALLLGAACLALPLLAWRIAMALLR